MSFYSNSVVMDLIMQALGLQFDKLYAASQAVLAQASVATADAWGLDIWEAELGLSDPTTVAPPLTQEERVARIFQQLRGQVSPTIANIIASMAVWRHGLATLYEDIPNYTVWIQWIGTAGVPSNRQVMETAVRALMPAHLVVNFIYGVLTWAEVDAHHWTWADVDILNAGNPETWDQFERLS